MSPPTAEQQPVDVIVDRLRALYPKVARPGRKTAEANEASREFAAGLNDAIGLGATRKGLARDLGISVAAVKRHLERHEYRTPPPSQVGRPSGWRAKDPK